MKSIKFLLSIAVLLILSIGIMAQNTEQSENECFEGGVLFGHCSNTDVDMDGTVDQDDIDWMYTCGYYLTLVDDALTIGNDEIPLEGCHWPERIIPRPEDPTKEKKKAAATPTPSAG